MTTDISQRSAQVGNFTSMASTLPPLYDLINDFPENDDFINKLPKVELHCHIEGTLPPKLRWKFAQRNKIKINYETEEDLLASYGTYSHRSEMRGRSTHPTFFEAYYGGMEVLREEEDFYEMAMSYYTRVANVNLRYAELFFDPQAHTRRGVDLSALMNGLRRAQLAAEKDLGIKSEWIMCFLRDMSPESAMEHYEAALKYRYMIKAIGLDSNEYDRPPSLFEEVFLRARKDGFLITCHQDVGQKDCHEHIRQIVEDVAGTGSNRMDHGLNAAEKPELIELIKSKNLGMTICPVAYARHEPIDEVFPRIRLLFDAGVLITINSDDPAYMLDKYVDNNLAIARKVCPFSKKELVQLELNAVEICWAPEELKDSIRKELHSIQV